MNFRILKIEFFVVLISCFLITSCKKFNTEFCNLPYKTDKPSVLTKIAFGSCSSENKDQPILNTVVSKSPDLFIYLGDNVYCDTKNADEMRDVYRRLSCKPEFSNLISSVFTLAVWDDHDFGVNDGGEDYCCKEKSKEIFLDFWNEPEVSERRNHTGIYHAVYFGDSAHLVQVILLDCRTFRTCQKSSGSDYIPDLNAGASMLGTEQWNWLENELRKPARLRIICSSTQFGTEYNGMESWSNYPYEQDKIVNLIKNTGAEHTLFLSGDVHYADISRRNYNGLYPLYDFTSSGLTQIDPFSARNIYRLGQAVMEVNAGMISIDWQQEILNLEVINLGGNTVLQHSIPFAELEF
jgi:alkaline phosphatase D